MAFPPLVHIGGGVGGMALFFTVEFRHAGSRAQNILKQLYIYRESQKKRNDNFLTIKRSNVDGF